MKEYWLLRVRQSFLGVRYHWYTLHNRNRSYIFVYSVCALVGRSWGVLWFVISQLEESLVCRGRYCINPWLILFHMLKVFALVLWLIKLTRVEIVFPLRSLSFCFLLTNYQLNNDELVQHPRYESMLHEEAQDWSVNSLVHAKWNLFHEKLSNESRRNWWRTVSVREKNSRASEKF